MLLAPEATLTRSAAVRSPDPDRDADPSAPATASRRWRRTVLVAGVVATAWAFAPFLFVALDAVAHHRVFVGVAGPYPWDGLQYLAWVRDAASHGLIRDLYGSAAGSHVFVHPMWTASGLLQAVTGVGPVAIMAFWKLASVLVLVGGCAFLVDRHIPDGSLARRAAALVLAVFGGLTPVALALRALVPWLWFDLVHASEDLLPASALWDYAPLAITIGAMPFAFEGIERILAGCARWRVVWATAGVGLLIAWLHPWQGETVAIAGGALVLWRLLERKSSGPGGAVPWLRLGLVLGATVVPLVYYLALSHFDAGWRISESTSVFAARIPLSAQLLGVVPLVLIAVMAARRSALPAAQRILLVWPLAVLVTLLISPSGQYRALDGIAIPVAVLAVRAWPRARSGWRPRVAAVAALSAMLMPTGVYAAEAFGLMDRPLSLAYAELARGDARAVRVAAGLAGSAPIVAPPALGTAIPVLSDAVSWLGHPVWTPDYIARETEVNMLFRGQLGPQQIRQLVRSAGARVLVQPCGWRASIGPELERLGFRAIAAGCARVYAGQGR